MRRTSEKEIEAVSQLDGPARFKHCIKRVVDEERAWGLWSDGWGMMATNDNVQSFPLWPAKEYADRCRLDDWAAYQAEEIGLDGLLNDLLPKLEQQGLRLGIFPTPTGKSVVVTASELASALREELEKYE